MGETPNLVDQCGERTFSEGRSPGRRDCDEGALDEGGKHRQPLEQTSAMLVDVHVTFPVAGRTPVRIAGTIAAFHEDRVRTTAEGRLSTMATMWHDRRVIVAGGTAGFGLVLARHLARAGARVLVVGRSSDGVRRALEACDQDGGAAAGIRGITADLGRAGEGNRVAGEAARILGGVDDVFCCVGRSGRARMLDTGDDELRDYLVANLFSATELVRAVADDVAAARGHVVFIGSLAGKMVTTFMGPYAVAKSALAAYADAVRLELEPRGGHVLLVSPGPIRRAADDPAADRAADRYADEARRAGLPDGARAAGGSSRLKQLDPDRLAEAVLSACRRRTAELTVPRKASLLAGLIEWFPDRGRRLLGRFVR